MSTRDKVRIGAIVLEGGIGVGCLIVLAIVGAFTPFLAIGPLALILAAIAFAVDLTRKRGQRNAR